MSQAGSSASLPVLPPLAAPADSGSESESTASDSSGAPPQRQQGSSLTCETGSPNFMAPELMQPGHARVDAHKCDMYSLGVTLWCMWSRARDPYPVLRDAHAVIEAVRKGARPFLQGDPGQGAAAGGGGGNAHVPARLRQLVHLLWHASPAQRPAIGVATDMLRRSTGDEELEKAGFARGEQLPQPAAARAAAGASSRPGGLSFEELASPNAAWRDEWDHSIGLKVMVKQDFGAPGGF